MLPPALSPQTAMRAGSTCQLAGVFVNPLQRRVTVFNRGGIFVFGSQPIVDRDEHDSPTRRPVSSPHRRAYRCCSAPSRLHESRGTLRTALLRLDSHWTAPCRAASKCESSIRRHRDRGLSSSQRERGRVRASLTLLPSNKRPAGGLQRQFLQRGNLLQFETIQKRGGLGVERHSGRYDYVPANLRTSDEGTKMSLNGKRLLIFVGDDYEDLELWYPKLRLIEAGVHVVGGGAAGGEGLSREEWLPVQVRCGDQRHAVGRLRRRCCAPAVGCPTNCGAIRKVLSLTREFDSTGKLVAAICHGGWIPISANVYRGVKVTGSPGIKDDLINAGGLFEDSARRHRPPPRHQPQARRPARVLQGDAAGVGALNCHVQAGRFYHEQCETPRATSVEAHRQSVSFCRLRPVASGRMADAIRDGCGSKSASTRED